MSEIKEGQTMQLPRRKQKDQQVFIKHYTENLKDGQHGPHPKQTPKKLMLNDSS
jgi:hypothetical protein